MTFHGPPRAAGSLSASARLKPAMPVTPMIKATGVSEVLCSMVREKKKRRGRMKKKREPGVVV